MSDIDDETVAYVLENRRHFEDLRQITDEWERIWFLDQPSHMTMYRTHGGVL